MAELLKEAIADAKAVREVALQNAKMALEEAFDSKIKNMLSAKLAEEIEEDVELEGEVNVIIENPASGLALTTELIDGTAGGVTLLSTRILPSTSMAYH